MIKDAQKGAENQRDQDSDEHLSLEPIKKIRALTLPLCITEELGMDKSVLQLRPIGSRTFWSTLEDIEANTEEEEMHTAVLAGL